MDRKEVTHRLFGAEVQHRPSGRMGIVTGILSPDGVYVDFGGEAELLDAEDVRR